MIEQEICTLLNPWDGAAFSPPFFGPLLLPLWVVLPFPTPLACVLLSVLLLWGVCCFPSSWLEVVLSLLFLSCWCRWCALRCSKAIRIKLLEPFNQFTTKHMLHHSKESETERHPKGEESSHPQGAARRRRETATPQRRRGKAAPPQKEDAAKHHQRKGGGKAAPPRRTQNLPPFPLWWECCLLPSVGGGDFSLQKLTTLSYSSISMQFNTPHLKTTHCTTRKRRREEQLPLPGRTIPIATCRQAK